MNLVAKEGPSVSNNDTALILSRNAGAADDLADGALLVNPFDTAELAGSLQVALEMAPEERASRAKSLVVGASALPPRDWFDAQRGDLRALREG
jgi:trehalose 6-phosphate synthase